MDGQELDTISITNRHGQPTVALPNARTLLWHLKKSFCHNLCSVPHSDYVHKIPCTSSPAAKWPQQRRTEPAHIAIIICISIPVSNQMTWQVFPIFHFKPLHSNSLQPTRHTTTNIASRILFLLLLTSASIYLSSPPQHSHQWTAHLTMSRRCLCR